MILKKYKKSIIILAFILLSVITYLCLKNSYLSENKAKPVFKETVSDKKQNVTISIDFDGDEKNETIKVQEVSTGKVSMTVYNDKGKKIAELWDGLNLYPTNLFKIVKLNEKSNKQYLQWNMAVGPHQIETVFLTIVDKKVQPLYSFDFTKNTMYSPFYTSRGEIVVGDTNYDGLLEVIENIDEYPVDTPRMDDKEIEENIRKQFSNKGVEFNKNNAEEILEKDNNITGGMLEIIKRENNGIGRGRKVIMAIHSFVDAETPFFRKLTEKEYEEIAGRLVAASVELENRTENQEGIVKATRFLSYNELGQDSIEFNNLVRKFWTHERIYEIPIPDNKDTFR